VNVPPMDPEAVLSRDFADHDAASEWMRENAGGRQAGGIYEAAGRA